MQVVVSTYPEGLLMSTISVREPQNLTSARPPFGRRIAPRRRLAVPMYVTVLRSGVPDAVPGRSVDVSEAGVGAILAAELYTGELVGVEFRLPDAGPVQAKARVCYTEKLRCGLKFMGIPADLREMLGSWALEYPIAVHPKFQAPALTAPVKEIQSQPPAPNFLADTARKTASANRYMRRKILMLLAASVIVATGVGWWQWEQGWQELESRQPGRSTEIAQTRVAVPPDVMQRLLVHKVDPVMPRGSHAAGVVVVSAVIGRDGSVMSVRPVSGPEALTAAAVDSVRWWKFEPYRQDGTSVEVETNLAIEFR
jgi:hypothetical protein